MARTKADPKKKENKTEKKGEKKKDHFDATGGVKKRPHRWKPGTVALRDIRRYQKSVDMLIPKAPMDRLIAEIAQDMMPGGVMFQAKAKEALRCAAEDYLTENFRNINKLALGRKGKTIAPRDLQLLKSLKETC